VENPAPTTAYWAFQGDTTRLGQILAGLNNQNPLRVTLNPPPVVALGEHVLQLAIGPGALLYWNNNLSHGWISPRNLAHARVESTSQRGPFGVIPGDESSAFHTHVHGQTLGQLAAGTRDLWSPPREHDSTRENESNILDLYDILAAEVSERQEPTFDFGPQASVSQGPAPDMPRQDSGGQLNSARQYPGGSGEFPHLGLRIVPGGRRRRGERAEFWVLNRITPDDGDRGPQKELQYRETQILHLLFNHHGDGYIPLNMFEDLWEVDAVNQEDPHGRLRTRMNQLDTALRAYGLMVRSYESRSGGHRGRMKNLGWRIDRLQPARSEDVPGLGLRITYDTASRYPWVLESLGGPGTARVELGGYPGQLFQSLAMQYKNKSRNEGIPWRKLHNEIWHDPSGKVDRATADQRLRKAVDSLKGKLSVFHITVTSLGSSDGVRLVPQRVAGSHGDNSRPTKSGEQEEPVQVTGQHPPLGPQRQPAPSSNGGSVPSHGQPPTGQNYPIMYPPGYGSAPGYVMYPPGYGSAPGYVMYPPGYGSAPGYVMYPPGYGSAPGYVMDPAQAARARAISTAGLQVNSDETVSPLGHPNMRSGRLAGQLAEVLQVLIEYYDGGRTLVSPEILAQRLWPEGPGNRTVGPLISALRAALGGIGYSIHGTTRSGWMLLRPGDVANSS
jgi:DNA-binding winged helix-turn-helix (wHTH) protein